ncbi:MAG: amino acid permease [Anaerolineales bacterium]|nr:amino acid permease [Anaerolineales bacterium]
MSKRQLKRQLNLAQVIMLGTAGAIGAEIFLLTGHVAGLVGSATVLVLLAGGMLTYSIALNYCEMATAYPVTGGAMTYVREAFGNNIISFLVGSLDCLSSTFYAALSAVGFAYSLSIFVPALPIVPAALAILGLFTVLNVLGVANVGRVQVLLGVVLLICFAVYIVLGFVRPGGFEWVTFMAGGRFFIREGMWRNLVAIMNAIALIYVVYVGFEVIADDAEEIENPNHNIPLAILISLGVVMVVNVSVALVTLGVVPWPEAAGSQTLLTDAVGRFLPAWGVPMMAIAGLIATLTTINTSMLSATREAFTLSRDGVWPRVLSRLSRARTPFAAILGVGLASALITVTGQAAFLSYISSAGYLFVLFWASLAMVRLRKLYPDLKRPFKVPLFPLTAYLAAATGFLIIAFSEVKALLFLGAVIVILSVLYYGSKPVARMLKVRSKSIEATRNRILVPVANPKTAESLVRVASILAQASEDTLICVLTVTLGASATSQGAQEAPVEPGPRNRVLLDRVTRFSRLRNVPLYTKVRTAPSVSQGILAELEKQHGVKLIMMGWPGLLNSETLPANPANEIVRTAHTNVAVLVDRGLTRVRNILVPVGGGLHSRLAIRLAYEIARQENAQIDAVHLFPLVDDAEQEQDELSQLHDIIEDELGVVPARITMRVAHASSVAEGILAETTRQSYDLIVAGASEEWADRLRLFGTVDDMIADKANCSVLLVRRYEPVAIAWWRRRIKALEREYEQNGNSTQ